MKAIQQPQAALSLSSPLVSSTPLGDERGEIVKRQHGHSLAQPQLQKLLIFVLKMKKELDFARRIIITHPNFLLLASLSGTTLQSRAIKVAYIKVAEIPSHRPIFHPRRNFSPQETRLVVL